MADVSKLNDAVTKLNTDVDALIAARPKDPQPEIDAATEAVLAIDGKVLSATPQG